MIRLHDSATGKVRKLALRQPGKVSMYVCGPTVYGPPHLGHGRFSLVFDVLRRYLAWSGFEVTYVSNITDVDDKIIQRAEREGRDPADIAARCEAVWHTAMDAIGVQRPDAEPHATDYVPRMVEAIAELVANGSAYATSDGVYFSVDSVADYGLLARQSLDSLRAGARVEVSEEKRSPVDFALWKAAKPDELSWTSPWGPGRPGWHTECVVMALDELGEGFDLHGGGQDLAFPHHENERAQAVALGKAFAGHWVHNGFVEVAGEKMSKSVGNFTNLLDLTESVDPRAFRLLVLQSHYRSPIDVTPETTRQAEAALIRLDTFALSTQALPPTPAPDAVLDRFRNRMDDDLDTVGALAIMFETVREGNSALSTGSFDRAGAARAALDAMCAAVGLALTNARFGYVSASGAARIGGSATPSLSQYATASGTSHGGGSATPSLSHYATASGTSHGGGSATPSMVPSAVLDKAIERDAARQRRDFAAADAIRDELQAQGWIVEDTPAGTRVRQS